MMLYELVPALLVWCTDILVLVYSLLTPQQIPITENKYLKYKSCSLAEP